MMSIVFDELEDKCRELYEDIAIFEELLWELDSSDMEDKDWARTQLLQQLDEKRKQLTELEQSRRSATNKDYLPT